MENIPNTHKKDKNECRLSDKKKQCEPEDNGTICLTYGHTKNSKIIFIWPKHNFKTERIT